MVYRLQPIKMTTLSNAETETERATWLNQQTELQLKPPVAISAAHTN